MGPKISYLNIFGKYCLLQEHRYFLAFAETLWFAKYHYNFGQYLDKGKIKIVNKKFKRGLIMA
jgi:hypothetical protein